MRPSALRSSFRRTMLLLLPHMPSRCLSYLCHVLAKVLLRRDYATGGQIGRDHCTAWGTGCVTTMGSMHCDGRGHGVKPRVRNGMSVGTCKNIFNLFTQSIHSLHTPSCADGNNKHREAVGVQGAKPATKTKWVSFLHSPPEPWRAHRVHVIEAKLRELPVRNALGRKLMPRGTWASGA